MRGQLPLVSAALMLLVLTLPLKAIWSFEAVYVAVLRRLVGLVEHDQQDHAVVLESEPLVPHRSVVAKGEEWWDSLAGILSPLFEPCVRPVLLKNWNEPILVAFSPLNRTWKLVPGSPASGPNHAR